MRVLKIIGAIILGLLVGIIIFAQSLNYFFDVSYPEIPVIALKMIKFYLNNETHNINQKAQLLVLFCVSISCFLIIISCIFLSKTKKDSYGKAKFATLKDLKRMSLNTKKGVWLGNFNNKAIKASEPLSMLIIAPPGTGKSAGIVLSTMLTLRNSMIVFDIKGELEKITRNFREKVLKNETYIFNPFGISIKGKEENGQENKIVDFGEHNLFFNPFDSNILKGMSYPEINQLVYQVANTIFISDKKDYWFESAKILFIFLALHSIVTKGSVTLFEIAQAPQKDYYNELSEKFKELATYWDQEEQSEKQDPKINTFHAWLIQTANSEEKIPLHYGILQEDFMVIKNHARRYQHAAREEFAGVIGSFMPHMQIFSDPRVREATSKNNFFIENLRASKQTIYIKVAEKDTETLGNLIRIFVEFIAKTLCSGESKRIDFDDQIYFILDEFVRFGRMDFLLRMPELSRSYGLVPIFISQSFEQFEEVYSKALLGILISITHYQVIFRLNSYNDAKIASDSIGSFTRERVSKSNNGLLKQDGLSISQEGYALVTPQDIISQDVDDILIIVSGFKYKPLKAKRNLYFKNKKLMKKLNLSYNKEQKVKIVEEEAVKTEPKLNQEDQKHLEDFGFVITEENDETEETRAREKNPQV